VTDGLFVFGHLSTNTHDFVKHMFHAMFDSLHMKELKPVVSMLLQKGFNFAVTLPELNALDFVAPDHELTKMTTSVAGPMIEG